MPFLTGFVDNTGSEGYAHWQMLDTIRRFAGGYGTHAAPTFAGTGTGALSAIDTHPASVSETWTIACTNAGTPGAEIWSVTGSVSGAKANATTGVAYDNGLVAFQVVAGATPFAVGDQFSLRVTQGALSAIGRAWTVLRYVNPIDITQNRELILQGSGLSGTEQIFIGLRAYQSTTADYYNLSVAGFTGYVPANAFTAQPGYFESGVPAHNLRVDYWLAVNGQRLILAMKVGTPVYESAYAGKFLPYGTPGQYPYPLVAGGMLVGVPATRFSDPTHSDYIKGNRQNLGMLFVDGAWHNPESWPWDNGVLAGVDPTNITTPQLRDTGGNYPLLPAILTDGANVYGELDGVYYISGFNNVVESTLSINGTPHVVIQDVGRTSFTDYYAMRLD